MCLFLKVNRGHVYILSCVTDKYKIFIHLYPVMMHKVFMIFETKYVYDIFSPCHLFQLCLFEYYSIKCKSLPP